MNRIEIEKMNFRHLDYAFAKVSGWLFCDDAIIIRQKNGNMSVYNFSNFAPSKDLLLLKELLEKNNFSLKAGKDEQGFFVELEGRTVRDESENIVLLKSYLFHKTDGFVDVPKKIGK